MAGSFTPRSAAPAQAPRSKSSRAALSSVIWLTDSDSDISGYKLAKLGSRSDCCSLVRAVTNTTAGPTSGVQITRTAGGTTLGWITEPLDGTDMTAATWEAHIWAKESSGSANVALHTQVLRYTNAEG